MSDLIPTLGHNNEQVLPCVYLTGDDLRAPYAAADDREPIRAGIDPGDRARWIAAGGWHETGMVCGWVEEDLCSSCAARLAAEADPAMAGLYAEDGQ